MGAHESRNQHKLSGDKRTKTQNGADVVRIGQNSADGDRIGNPQKMLDIETEKAITDLENAIRSSDTPEHQHNEPLCNSSLTMNQPIIDDDASSQPLKKADIHAQPITRKHIHPDITGNNKNGNSPPPKPQRADNSKHLNREIEQPEQNIRLSSPHHTTQRIATENTDASSHNNMNTIKQAKVNVRDRINVFKTDDVVRQLPIQLKPTNRRPKTTIEISSQQNLTPRKTSNDNRVDFDLHNSYIPRQMTPKHVLTEQNFKNNGHKEELATQSPRNGAVGRRLSADDRMNTLDVFNRLKKDHEVLNKFEKAKPAARRNKRKPHTRVSMAPELELEHRNHLPRTEISEQFGSIPDLVRNTRSSDEDIDQVLQENEDRRERLATINTKTGQKYAMDDTAYETLRRKKIAGQRPAIGVIDTITEKNLLLSLKRNFQFKRHVQLDDDVTEHDETTHTNHITDIVF